MSSGSDLELDVEAQRFGSVMNSVEIVESSVGYGVTGPIQPDTQDNIELSSVKVDVEPVQAVVAETTCSVPTKTHRTLLQLFQEEEEKLSGEDTGKQLPAVENVPPEDDQLLSSEAEVPPESHVVWIHEESSEDSSSPESQPLLPGSFQVQREHIFDIVKNKNLQGLSAIGGVERVAEALQTDLQNGISCFTRNRHVKCSLSKILNRVLNSSITFFQCLFDAFKNPIIILICIYGTLYLAFGISEKSLAIGRISMAFVAFCVVLNVIGTIMRKFFKRMKSKKILRNITLGGMEVEVCRGYLQSIFAYELQVGDLVVLRKGCPVPADGIFVSGDQSLLELDGDGLVEPTIIDKENPFMFYGYRVLSGNCLMIVTSVGMETVWGEMMIDVIGSLSENCEFESNLHKLDTQQQIAWIILSIFAALVVFVHEKSENFGDKNGYKPDIKGEPSGVKIVVDIVKGIFTRSRWTARIVLALLSVFMIAVEDGMPVVVSLAIILWNRRTELVCKASVRNYLACLKMASVTTIVTDKVGRLMEKDYEISTRYTGEEFVSESSVVAPNVLEDLCDGIGALSLISRWNGESKVQALVLWAETKLGMKKASMSEQCEIISPVGCNPFQEYCHVLVKKNGTQGKMSYLHCYGPPETILYRCSRYYDAEGNKQPIDGEKIKIFQYAFERMQAEDEAKVVAFACKCINISDETSEAEGSDLIFLGMISMIKEKREEIKRAVSALQERGIRTVLVSIEDISVLESLGHKYELPGHDSDNLIIQAEQFRSWNEEERTENVDKLCIMGNCLPRDRILFIKSLQKKGKVVALLGQRTIDAPALKQADIGITIGSWSSEVARDSADINICGGDFSNMVNLIMNGRSYEDKVRIFMQLELISIISSSLITFASILILGNAPMSSGQVLWMSFAVAVCGGLVLLSVPPTDTRMAPQSLLVTEAMLRNVVFQAGYQTIIFMSLQLLGHVISLTSGEQLQSMVYNGLFLCQTFNTFPSRRPADINFFRGLLHTGWLFLSGIVLLLTCQALSWIFIAPRMSWELWCIILCISLFGWVIDSVGKIISLFAPFRAEH